MLFVVEVIVEAKQMRGFAVRQIIQIAQHANFVKRLVEKIVPFFDDLASFLPAKPTFRHKCSFPAARMSMHSTVIENVACPNSLRIRYRSAMTEFGAIFSAESGAKPHNCGV